MVKILSVYPSIYVKPYLKIMHFFFDYPTKEFGLNDLCAHLKISKTTANRVVQNLVRAKFLKVERISNLWRVRHPPDEYFDTRKKFAYHLDLIFTSGIIEEVRKKFPNPKVIILFGSYRKGDDTHESDIDIGVEIVGDKEMKVIELGTIAKLGYRENVKVNLHVFTRKKINPNLFANIANGIVLDGFLEVRP